MNIEKRYWKWDEELNSTEYKLGNRIDDLLSKGLVEKTEQGSNIYTGIDGFPWKIEIADGRIVSIFYRDRFFLLPDMGIWDLDLKEFEYQLNKLLQPVDKEEECDKLVVSFRESFVAIAGIVSFKGR